MSEGWQNEKYPHQRVYHYIRDMNSLCGRLGFYRGELDDTAKPTKYDCKACARILAKERATS